MTKEEAKKYIKSNMCNDCGIYLGGGRKCPDNCKVIEVIKALEQTRWIPVSERPPEEYMVDTSSCSDYVLITTEWEDGSTELGIDRTVDGKWILNTYDDGDTITAWMPLPPPYKAESEDKK